jgi:hypothetical protein
MILAQLQGNPMSLDALRDWALLETVYRPGQVRGVVQSLLASGALARDGAGHLNGETTVRVGPSKVQVQEQLSLL